MSRQIHKLAPALRLLFPQRCCLEGIALFEVAGTEAASEPLDALGRTTVRKGIRRQIASPPLLQAVVADGASGAERLLDIPFLENLPAALGVMGP